MNTRFPRYAGLLAVLLAAAPAVAPAQLYQYTDKSGNTVYTDHPPQNRESKQKRLREDGVYLSGESTVRPPASRGRTEEKELQQGLRRDVHDGLVRLLQKGA
jgi:hypothetical protein